MVISIIDGSHLHPRRCRAPTWSRGAPSSRPRRTSCRWRPRRGRSRRGRAAGATRGVFKRLRRNRGEKPMVNSLEMVNFLVELGRIVVIFEDGSRHGHFSRGKQWEN